MEVQHPLSQSPVQKTELAAQPVKLERVSPVQDKREDTGLKSLLRSVSGLVSAQSRSAGDTQGLSQQPELSPIKEGSRSSRIEEEEEAISPNENPEAVLKMKLSMAQDLASESEQERKALALNEKSGCHPKSSNNLVSQSSGVEALADSNGHLPSKIFSKHQSLLQG